MDSPLFVWLMSLESGLLGRDYRSRVKLPFLDQRGIGRCQPTQVSRTLSGSKFETLFIFYRKILK